MTWAGSRIYITPIVAALFAALLVSACARQQTQAVDLYGPHFCYRTLAEVDCHEAALPGEDHRAVGHYEAARGHSLVAPGY